MKNTTHRMIYLADEDLFRKIKEMKKLHHLNISSLIRDFLKKKYIELEQNKND